MINEINNHLDQVSAHPLFFKFNGLNFNFRSHFFSIRGRNIETRVYAGESSSGRVYEPIYMGKAKNARVYAALYATFTDLANIQVCEQNI
jgi:hypothetical protein